MSTPEQKPGRSRQDYRTPRELLSAIERDFAVSSWACDLAADEHDSINGPHYFGPGSPLGEDSLSEDWSKVIGDLWLNPPFARLLPWARKCHATRNRHHDNDLGLELAEHAGRIFLLAPAAVGSNWYAEHVHGTAHVVALRPRVTFVGEQDPYPKDLILAIYGPVRGGFSTWRWK